VATLLALACACGVEGQPTLQRLPRSFDTFTVDAAPEGALHALWGADSSDIWAVGEAGTMLRYDGRRWERVGVPTTRTLRAIHGCAADDIWAVGSDVVLHFDGQDWRRQPTDGLYPGKLRSVFCAAPGEVWAAEHYTVIRWVGGRWQRAGRLADEEPRSPTVVWGPSGGGIWASGADGIFRFAGGKRWAREGRHALPIHAIAGTAHLRWAAGDGGLLRYRPAKGSSRAGWFSVSIPGARLTPFSTLCVDTEGGVVAAGPGGLAQLRDERWSLDERVSPHQHINALWHAPSGEVFGVGAEIDREATRPLLLKLRERVVDARLAP
jgi:hypothetical protein